MAGCARPRAGEEALRTRRGGPGRQGLPDGPRSLPPSSQGAAQCGVVPNCEVPCCAGWKPRWAWGQAWSSLQESRDWRTPGLAPDSVARVHLQGLCHPPRTRGLGPRRRAAAGKQAGMQAGWQAGKQGGRQAGWQAGKQAGACLGEARHPLGLRRVEKAFEAPRSSHWPVRPYQPETTRPVFSGKLSRVRPG